MPEQQINPRTNWPTLATRDHHMRAHDNSSSKRKTDKKSQPNVYPIYPLWCWSLMCGGAAGPVPDRLVCLLERGGPVHVSCGPRLEATSSGSTNAIKLQSKPITRSPDHDDANNDVA